MRTLRFKKSIVGVAVLAASSVAMAQSSDHLIQKYTPLVGTAANATAQVNGLRDGATVTMSSPVPVTAAACLPPPPAPVNIVPVMGFIPIVGGTVQFDPTTDGMGYGNVDNALTLAQGSLANIGIVTAVGDPVTERHVTPEDVCIALVGGDVQTKARGLISLPGILKLRSEGWGWGEISKHPLVGAKL